MEEIAIINVRICCSMWDAWLVGRLKIDETKRISGSPSGDTGRHRIVSRRTASYREVRDGPRR